MRAANYVEETTTSIAGTSGDGAITLTGITNTPRLSTVFGTQATTIRYVVEDTINKKFETGVGSVASNVLTRTRPQVTWDGTTYDDSTPSALQFGSSPTSGNIKVRLSATAETSEAAMPGINLTVAGDSNWRDYPITGTAAWNSSGGGMTMVADREYYVPYFLQSAGLLSGIQIEVVTLLAASNLKSALYPCNSAGLPGDKIVDFNVLSTGTTGFKSDTTTGTWTPTGPVWLTPGWYFVGLIDSSTPAIRGSAGSIGGTASRTPLGRKDSYGYGTHLFIAGNYTTGLPASPSLGSATMASGGTANSALWIGLKVTP